MTREQEPRRRFFLVPAILISFVLAAPDAGRAEALDGRWILDFDREDGRVQLTIKRSSEHGNWNSSSGYEMQEFRGLSRPAGSAAQPARFELVRDAGTFRFEGELDERGGSGRFQFAGNPEFEKAWTAMGHSALTADTLFAFTLHDVSRRFIEDLRSLGYERLPAERLISMRIHGANPEFIRELKALGYDRLPVDSLVNMRIHGASPDFVREMKSLGYERIPVEDLVSMRIHGVSPEYVRSIQALGYKRVPVEELVSMRIHGVSVEFAREMKQRYSDVTPDELVDMKIHGRR
jgi:uncharacterized protein (DUF433 family)